MTITYKQLNPHFCKTYLVKLDGEANIVLIDPVLDHLNDYRQLIQKNGYSLDMVIDTHTHADHISACSALRDIYDCDYLMHALAPAKCVSIRVKGGQTLTLFNKVDVDIMDTPGHTRDSISIVFQDAVFTGDALFLDDGGAGRDDLPGGNPESHFESLQKLSVLSDELIVYPAHDYRDRVPSSLKQQKVSNPHLQLNAKDDFINYINDLKLGPADWMHDVLKANYTCATDPKAAWIPADSPSCEVKGTMDLGVNDIQVDTISAVALKREMNLQIPLFLIDVRESDELEGPLGRIENSINIPITKLKNQLEELMKNKDQKIITICRSGARAHTAAQILKQTGVDNVSVLDGGMIAWQKVVSI